MSQGIHEGIWGWEYKLNVNSVYGNDSRNRALS